ncbi:MAG: DEAD/DEAH box helicase [Puniceicoccales bacterium]|jgi:ATP-dependent RNA helicase RhlE|nr:DEAD/DEAH box helicase [Puniceicoccales bacterium]
MSNTFSELGLSEPILRALASCGYHEPTPIQAKAIPLILQGKDIIGAAQTGTGKTAAFALPTLQRLETHTGTPRCLVLVPTRELAVQVEENFKRYGEHAGLSITLLYGGVSYGPQVRSLANGTDVVVATPGRLLDLWGQHKLRLDKIEVLILDEVDRMLDMGFIDDVSKIINLCPKERQTLLFSATVEKSILNIAKWALREPEIVDVRSGATSAETVAHYIYPVESYQKYELLLALLEKTAFKSVIVFTRTKRDADRITEWVESTQHPVTTMHADRSQRERQEALAGFKSGKYQVLVATDIAARGLDVRGISHVINYNVPDHPEDYVHRIGRTGRASEEGEAFTLFSPDEIPHLHAIEHLLGRQIERRKLEGFKYRFEPLMTDSPSASARPAGGLRRRNR